MAEPLDPVRRVALAAVGGAWLLAIVRYGGPGADLTRDDLAWLGSLESFSAGFEARKDYGQPSWGLLHLLGHLGTPSDGRVGPTLARLVTLAVPGLAWLAARLAREVSDRPAAPWVAAALAAWSPVVLLGASTLAFGVRAAAVAGGLLAGLSVDRWARTGRWRPLTAAVLAFAAALAFHPWAVVGPVVLAPLLAMRAGRDGRRWARTVGAALLLAVPLLWVLGSGQEHRAAAGARHLGSALARLPAFAAAHAAWQLPGLGASLPRLGLVLPAVLGLAGVGALLGRRTRSAGLLLLGALASALPEAAAPLGVGSNDLVWTGNHLKTTVAAGLAASVGLGAAVALAPPRRVAALLVGLLLVAVPRAVLFTGEQAAVAHRDAETSRAIADLLRGAAAVRRAPGLVGEASAAVRDAAFETRFVPELPRARIAGFAGRKNDFDAPFGGLDGAQWQTAVVRCRVLGGGDACARAPNLAARRGCRMDLSTGAVDGCEPTPIRTTPPDRQAAPWAAVLLGLVCLGAYARRPGDGTDAEQQLWGGALAAGVGAAVLSMATPTLPPPHAGAAAKAIGRQPQPAYGTLPPSRDRGVRRWQLAPGSQVQGVPVDGTVRFDLRDLDGAAPDSPGVIRFELTGGSGPTQPGVSIPVTYSVQIDGREDSGEAVLSRSADRELELRGERSRLLLRRR